VNIKYLIDYLFWKRTWFRLWFIILPIVPLGLTFFIGFFIYLLGGNPYEEGMKNVFIALYGGLFVLGMYDNNNMDGCDKKLTPFSNPFLRSEND